MKLTDMIVVLPAVNNGWAFRVYSIVAVWLLFRSSRCA